MKYQRKTFDEYQLLIDYGNGFEVVLTESTLKEIKQRKQEYWNNESCWIDMKIKKVRVHK